MALNWAMLDTKRVPVLLPGESIIMTVQPEVALLIPQTDDPTPTPPASTSASASSKVQRKSLKEAGTMWLTDQRLIFVAAKENPTLDSVSIPLLSLLHTSYEQPLFGANYVSIDVKPTPGGGLTLGTKVEIRFKDRGIFEFSDVVEKTRERAIYMKRQAASDEETLPTYEDGAGDRPPTIGTSTPNPVPEENPPGYNA